MNKTLVTLKLIRMDFGDSNQDLQMLSDFFLFNETLEYVDFSHNQIKKLALPIKNLVRNRLSNILTLNFESN